MARFKNASVPELVYRGKQVLFAQRLRVFGAGRSSGPIPSDPGREWVNSLLMPELRHNISEQLVEQILSGKEFCLNENPLVVSKSQKRFARAFFADIRHSALQCDIRSVWEPARMQHVSILCAHLQQGAGVEMRGRIGNFVREAVIRWLDDNPFPYGLNYMSAMECGLRIPALFYVLKTIDLSDGEFARVAEAIRLHAWFTRRRLSLYSSLGNHTIAECTGLVFAGAVFRKSAVGMDWLQTSVAILKREIGRQILPDGGPAEQSLGYHRFVLDLCWLVVDFLTRNALADCSDQISLLTAGENFYSAFGDSRGNITAIGDSDDGCAIAPGIAPSRPEGIIPVAGIRTFPLSGYTIIRCPNGGLFTFDHGPLGMPPLFNHGHADALSITLSLDGKPFLVDPGTYRYNGNPEYRAYFKGTLSHSTVTIDREDQAIQETGFIWSKPYKTGIVRRWEKNGIFLIEAVHDGYGRLRAPVRHKRTICHFDGSNFLIRDSFWGEGAHLFELHYHLHPEATVERENAWWRIDNSGSQVFLMVTEGQGHACNGERSVIVSGWFSPAYGIKSESRLLRCTGQGLANEVVFTSFICTGTLIEKERQEEILCCILQDA